MTIEFSDLIAARSVLCLSVEAEPVIFTQFGYPADVPGPKVGKPMAEMVRYEHWYDETKMQSK